MGDALGISPSAKTYDDQHKAIQDNKALADRLFAMGMPAYGKKAKKGLWQMLDPMLAQYSSGQMPQIISPDLENQQWSTLKNSLDQQNAVNRTGIEQGMANRGLDYGNIATNALARSDQGYGDVLAKAGTGIRTEAAQLNYGAQQDYINRLMNMLYSLFSKGETVRQGREGQSIGMQSDANAAGGLASSNYWSSLSNSVGQGIGSLPWQQWFQGTNPNGTGGSVPGYAVGADMGGLGGSYWG